MFKLLTVALAALPLIAQAHTSFLDEEVVSNTRLITSLRVPHGCNGGPTLNMTMWMPEGFVFVAVEQESGYEITTTLRELDPPLLRYGQVVNTTVDTIFWDGELPDELYRYFGLQFTAPNVTENTTMFFDVVQDCGSEFGKREWIGEENGAPSITVLPPTVDAASTGNQGTDDSNAEDSAATTSAASANVSIFMNALCAILACIVIVA